MFAKINILLLFQKKLHKTSDNNNDTQLEALKCDNQQSKSYTWKTKSPICKEKEYESNKQKEVEFFESSCSDARASVCTIKYFF